MTDALVPVVPVVGQDDTPPSACGGSSRARTVPFVVPPLLADVICAMIADGTSLVRACQQIGIPDSTVDGWVLKDAVFAARYEHARRKRFDRMAEECMDIADDKSQDDIIDDMGFRRPNKEWIARSRVRIQTRLDLLARWDPKRYGAKLELKGDLTTRNLNFNVPVDPVAASHAYVDMMRGRPQEG